MNKKFEETPEDASRRRVMERASAIRKATKQDSKSDTEDGENPTMNRIQAN